MNLIGKVVARVIEKAQRDHLRDSVAGQVFAQLATSKARENATYDEDADAAFTATAAFMRARDRQTDRLDIAKTTRELIEAFGASRVGGVQ